MYDFRDKVKELRIQKGLSQKELVELTGITQASISQIETKKVMPYGITIKKLSKALDFDFESILPASVIANDAGFLAIFEAVDEQIQAKEYQLAYQKLMTEINPDELISLGVQKRYYYYLGLIKARGTQEFNKAIFHYMQVVCMQKRSLYIEMKDVEALYELAYAYQQLDESENATYFYQEALLLTKEIKSLNRENQIKIIEIYYNWGQNELQLKNSSKALEILGKVIELSLEWDCSVYLGQANFDIAELYYQQKNYNQAKDYLAKAKAIGDAYQNEELLQKVAILNQT